jgi:hypothetical protein
LRNPEGTLVLLIRNELAHAQGVTVRLQQYDLGLELPPEKHPRSRGPRPSHLFEKKVEEKMQRFFVHQDRNMEQKASRKPWKRP